MLKIIITVVLLVLVGTLAIVNNGHATTGLYVCAAILAVWGLFLVGSAFVGKKS